MRVALLAGGTGGAKLAAGVQDLVGADLAVIANTADDTRIHGLHVSPDPDLVTYWLAGEIDTERGWGIKDDSFTVHERIERLGAPGWFQLSDRDLATCLYRTHFIAEGGTLTAAQEQIARALGVSAAVRPMCEERVETWVLAPSGWMGLQRFLIVEGSEPPIEAVEVRGLDDAAPTVEVLDALRTADAIVLGPSNPVISIGPILAVPGMREAISGSGAPVIAVSPFVAGRAVKGPTEKFMTAIKRPISAEGVASLYVGLLDAMVVDSDDPEPAPSGLRSLSCPTLMADAETRRELAERVLELADELRGIEMSEPVAIIPVKRFGAAKQRLLEVLDGPERAGLVEAMLTDVLDAASRSERLGRVVVVSGDSRAEQVAIRSAKRASAPIEVLRDPDDLGHSKAAMLGVARAKELGADAAALLPGDCPLLDPVELDAALERVHGDRVAIVPDRHGTGTNALVLAPPDAIAPAFGPGSCARHAELGQRAGHTVEVERLESLALDLDTPADLAEMITALGRDPDRAPATTSALERTGRLGAASRG